MAEKNTRPREDQELVFMNAGKKSALDKTGLEASSTTPAQQQLSPVPEQDSWERETGFPSSSRSLDEHSTSSSISSLSEPQERGDDCAELVLNCLFCRFYDLFLMLPETCEQAAHRICPAYMHFSSAAEPTHAADRNCSCNFDCGLTDACRDTGQCFELAMEMSEVCYR